MRETILCAVMALSVAACTTTTVAPETPKFVSIQGHGTSSATNKPDVVQFRFDLPGWNATTEKTVWHIGTTVRFTVPYPTSLELQINGKPLTKAEPPLSTNYEYAGRIENPGANPATWSVDILTPFDVAYTAGQSGQVGYVLSIVDVAGSNRSQPLEIHYNLPLVVHPPDHHGDDEHDLHQPPQHFPAHRTVSRRRAGAVVPDLLEEGGVVSVHRRNHRLQLFGGGSAAVELLPGLQQQLGRLSLSEPANRRRPRRGSGRPPRRRGR